jgi:S1-C subfamily serine protease
MPPVTLNNQQSAIDNRLPPIRVIRCVCGAATMVSMTNSSLVSLSTELADLSAAGAAAVVQVLGARRPASGVVHGPDTIITTARALGREDGLRVRVNDADPVETDLAGWDPATGIAVLRTRTKLDAAVLALAESEPRVGQIVLALARSWSNSLTASAGIVAVVGGPLRTGRRREISRVIRVTAPMHDGFAGGALLDASGRLSGITTAAVIRGFGVAIPASIAWAAAHQVLTVGSSRGFVGVAVQPVHLSAAQRTHEQERGLLVVGVTPESPAEAAGVIVGDILLQFGDKATESAEDLLDRLTGNLIGQKVKVRTLHGGQPRDVEIGVASRPRH